MAYFSPSRQVLGLHQVVDRLGQREIIHARIAQRQVQQLQKGDGRGGPGHNIQHQQLQIQFTLDILYGTWTHLLRFEISRLALLYPKKREDKALFLQPARPSLPVFVQNFIYPFPGKYGIMSWANSQTPLRKEVLYMHCIRHVTQDLIWVAATTASTPCSRPPIRARGMSFNATLLLDERLF